MIDDFHADEKGEKAREGKDEFWLDDLTPRFDGIDLNQEISGKDSRGNVLTSI